MSPRTRILLGALVSLTLLIGAGYHWQARALMISGPNNVGGSAYPTARWAILGVFTLLALTLVGVLYFWFAGLIVRSMELSRANRESTTETNEHLAADGNQDTELAHLQRIFDAAPYAMLLVDTQGKVKQINDFCVQFAGADRLDMLETAPGNALSCIHSREDAKGCGHSPSCPACSVRRVIVSVLTSGNAIPGAEVRLERFVDGKQVNLWLKINANAVVIDGQRHVVLTMDDISDRKNAEEEFCKSESRQRLILQAAGEGIYGLDTDGNTTFVNPTAARLLGWDAEELIGQPQHSIIHHTKPDGTPYPREICPIYAAFKDGVVRKVDNEVFWRQDGTSFPIEYTSTPICDEQGQIAGAVVIFQDITERKRAEETIRRHSETLEATVQERTVELQHAKEVAETASLAKSRFLANVSHELRTPLHAVLSFADFGVKRHATAEPGKLNEYFLEIKHSGETLLALINDLLDLAKLESVKMPLEFQHNDLASLITSVTEEFGAMASQRQVSVEHRGLELGIAIRLDGTKIKQVLRNLLSNALKFSPNGGTIEVALLQGQGAVTVTVRDQGPGIPEDEIETVFEKFVQSSTTKSDTGGTGLGLAICREIVAAHMGRIWAENDPRGGAVFVIEIPLFIPVDTTPTPTLASAGNETEY